MWHPVILVQLQPKRAGWFQLAACTHWFLHLAAIVEALCARAHFLRVFSGSLMNPPNRQKLWDDINRSCILLPRLLPESCRHNDRFLSVLVRLLFQAYLVLYRPKQGGRQGTAWRSSTLQDVRQNPSPALEESPHMGTEFGCKILFPKRTTRITLWREADLEARVLPRPLCKAHVHAADGSGHLC